MPTPGKIIVPIAAPAPAPRAVEPARVTLLLVPRALPNIFPPLPATYPAPPPAIADPAPAATTAAVPATVAPPKAIPPFRTAPAVISAIIVCTPERIPPTAIPIPVPARDSPIPPKNPDATPASSAILFKAGFTVVVIKSAADLNPFNTGSV